MVVESPEGKNDFQKNPAGTSSLNRWLCGEWKKQGPDLKRKIVASQRQQSAHELRNMITNIDAFIKGPVCSGFLELDAHFRAYQNTEVCRRHADLLRQVDLLVPKVHAAPPLQPWLMEFMKGAQRLQSAPIPPGLQALLKVIDPAVIRAAGGAQGQVMEAARALLAPPLEKSPPD